MFSVVEADQYISQTSLLRCSGQCSASERLRQNVGKHEPCVLLISSLGIGRPYSFVGDSSLSLYYVSKADGDSAI